MTTKIIARVSLKTIIDDMNKTNKTTITCKRARVALRKNRVAKIDDNYAFAQNEIARIRAMIDATHYAIAKTRTTRARKTRVVVDANA